MNNPIDESGNGSSINEALWDFPHHMTLKVFGDADNPACDLTLADRVCAILARHLKDFAPQNISLRPSSGGRYAALSVDICVHNREQVEGIYRDLKADPRVRMAL